MTAPALPFRPSQPCPPAINMSVPLASSLNPTTLVRAAEMLADGEFNDVLSVIREHAGRIAWLPRTEQESVLARLLIGHEAAGLDVGLMPRDARIFAQSADAWIRDAAGLTDAPGGVTVGTA